MRPLTSVLSTAVVVLTLTCSPASGDILVATAGPISGDLAYLGEQQVRGVEMALADLNAEGGVLGQTVRLQSVDDACDAERRSPPPGRRSPTVPSWSSGTSAPLPRSRRPRSMPEPAC
jgi:hypothetical protein